MVRERPFLLSTRNKAIPAKVGTGLRRELRKQQIECFRVSDKPEGSQKDEQ